MGRIRDAVVVGARAVYRVPVPAAVYTHSLREARRSLPPGRVQRTHAVDVEMLGRTRCVWLDRHLADRGVIVHLHGGAYVSGPFAGDWEWLSAQADAARCAGLMVDYRFGPDHTYPVAQDDALAVLTELARSGVIADGTWVLSGQNAGGGLALTVARRIRGGAESDDAAGTDDAEGTEGTAIPAPAGLVLMAPWVDLTLENTGITETGRHDPVHERRMLEAAARCYAGRTSLEDPDLSPLYADLAGIGPLHLSVGTRDILLTDTRIEKMQLEELGVDVTYREVGGRLGVVLRLRRGEDMQRLLREQAAFVERVLPRA